MLARRKIGILVGVLALALVAGCNSGDKKTPTGSGTTGKPSSAPSPVVADAVLTITPANGATGVAPAQTSVGVKVAGGTLDSVVLTNPDGKVVKGDLTADKLGWTLGEQLGYAKNYKLVVTAVNPDGKKIEAASSFTTLKAGNYTLPTITPGSGTVGVGQPVIVVFDEDIKDRKAAVAALSVTATPAVDGSWRWISNHEVHWRPAEYWKPGTKVDVKANVYGVDLGGGIFGQDDRAATFTIGQSKIAIVDTATHNMKVYFDGTKVQDFPVSVGKGGTMQVGNNSIDYWTRTGPHVVMDKANPVRMTSESYGGPKTGANSYDSLVGYAVRISNAGEYVHLRDWSLGDLGKVNDSHGCVNVGPGNAQWFYENFNKGDIVDVKGGPKVLDLNDGVGDWNIPYAQWAN